MIRRVTVSLPDDVADYLDGADNVSAAVTQALRAQMDRGAATEAMLRAAGFALPGPDQPRSRLAPLSAQQRAEIEQRRERLRSGDWQPDAR
jgi:hypothetical protein